jgi:hypothetical protein
MKTTIFTLTSARSGTLYLRHLFQNNVPDCVCRHEPFFDWGNPTLFGRAIFDAYAGRLEPVRELLAKKKNYIERLPGSVYVESSHAFLKSGYVAALEFFPNLRLVHLIRDPLKVARSAAYREAWRRRVHAPFHFYKGDDGLRHFAWALTGNEEIFQPFTRERLTLFQWYLLEWIEIENRAMRFLTQHQLQDRCFTLHSPADLNHPARIQEMFDFFGLPTIRPALKLAGRKNRSLGYSGDRTAEEERACAALLERLPGRYLDIFKQEPYAGRAWSARFQRGGANSGFTGAKENLALR